MTVNKAATAAQRKKIERDNWKADGGVYKEIKFTKEGLESLKLGREKLGFEKDWEFINYLLNEYKNTL